MATIRKRGDSYQIRVSSGYDSQYRQVVRTKTWKPTPGMTARQVENELNRQTVMFEQLCQKGVYPSNIKFDEFAEKWMTEYARTNLKNTTYQRMVCTSKRVLQTFGHMRVDKITHGHIQAFIDDLSTKGRNMKNVKPLARKSVIHHLNYLSDVFSYALRQGMLESNPCTNIFVPKGPKKEKQIYTVDEMKELLKLAETEGTLNYRTFITLAVYSGFRSGELLGLEWKDIDWKNNVISVRRTSYYTPTDGNFTDTPKTQRSTRSLKLPDVVFELLRKLKTWQEHNRRLYGTKWIESDRVFVTELGKPVFKGQPYKWHKSFTEHHGLRFCDIHSLRHFNATVLIQAGVDAATVSSALGHSSISTTTNIYCHAFQEAQARTGQVIASVMNFTDD